MHVITGYVRTTDGKHPVARVEIDTIDQGIWSLKIPHGQHIGYAIDNSEYREAVHAFEVDGSHLLAVVREGA